MKNTRVSSRMDTTKEELSNLEGVIEEFILKRTGKDKEIKIIIITKNKKERRRNANVWHIGVPEEKKIWRRRNI